MKLRLLNNSVRLRLQQGEVARIGAGESVIEHTPLPGGSLTYRLDIANSDSVSARLSDATLTVTLPRNIAAAWADSDQVSIAGELATTDGETVSVLIEKDFKCLSPGRHRDESEDADAFPHPEEPSGKRC